MYDALKKTLLGSALLWVVLGPLLWWLDIDLLWWIGVALFGIIGPVATFSEYLKAGRTRDRYDGLVSPDTYIPTFRCRGVYWDPEVIGSARADRARPSVAIVASDRLIFLVAEEALCRRPVADFWGEVKEEIAQVPVAAIRDIILHLPDEEVLKSAQREALATDLAVNLTAGLVLGKKIKSSVIEAVLIVQFENEGRDWFMVFDFLNSDRRFDFSQATATLGAEPADLRANYGISESERPAVWNARHVAALLDAALMLQEV